MYLYLQTGPCGGTRRKTEEILCAKEAVSVAVNEHGCVEIPRSSYVGAVILV